MDRAPRGLNIAFLLLLANSAYLAAFASPSLFYYTNVALHVVFGLVWLAWASPWLLRALSAPGAPIPRSARARLLGAVTTVLLIAGGLSGAALTVTGATRPWRWLLFTHIALATAGSVALGLLFLPRIVTIVRRPRPAHGFAGLALLGIVGWSSAVIATQRAVDRENARIVNPETVPASMDEEGTGRRDRSSPRRLKRTWAASSRPTFS